MASFFFPEEFGGSRISILTLSLSLAFKRSCQQPCWRKHEPRQLSPPSASISVWVVLCSLTIVTKMNKKASSIHRSLFDLRIWEMSTNCLFCVDYLCIYKPIKKTINILSRDIFKNCFFLCVTVIFIIRFDFFQYLATSFSIFKISWINNVIVEIN